jgi:hypothetical protein
MLVCVCVHLLECTCEANMDPNVTIDLEMVLLSKKSPRDRCHEKKFSTLSSQSSHLDASPEQG